MKNKFLGQKATTAATQKEKNNLESEIKKIQSQYGIQNIKYI